MIDAFESKKKPHFVINDEAMILAHWQIHVMASIIPDEIPLECN